MEVVGAIASIVVLIDVGKKLKHCVDEIPTNRRRLQDAVTSIDQDLEALHALIQSRQVNDTSALRDAISSLEADLQNGLRKCQKMLTLMSKFGWLKRALIWKDSGDIEVELVRIEQRIANCCRRFSTTGIARVEMSLAEISGMTDQLRTEVHQRLDFVEDHLRFRVMKAKADPADAEALVGTSRMSNAAIESALKEASEELERHSESSTALENQYLHIKVETLTNAIKLLPAEETPTQQSDPVGQTEDAVMRTIHILHALRTRSSSVPVTQIAADLEDLSTELLDLGLYEDARETYLQVVRIYRGSLPEDGRPAIIHAMVARGLIGVAASLQQLGRSQESVFPTWEAVSIFRSLENAHPGDFRHGLALALNNLANHLRDSHHFTEALTAANEAVGLRRQLTVELPYAHKADLAASLLNKSTCCSKLSGLEHEALADVAEAVTHSRDLVANQPEVFEPYLAASLHNAANRRAALHDDTNAYKDIQEAVGIRRKLAKTRPDIYTNGLMRSLTVAEKLAFRCGDVAGADRFREEQQQSHTSCVVMQSPSIPALSPIISLLMRQSTVHNYTPNTALYQVFTPAFEMFDPPDGKDLVSGNRGGAGITWRSLRRAQMARTVCLFAAARR